MTHCSVCSSELPQPNAPCPVCLVTKTSVPQPDATKTSAPISHREFLATVTRGADPIDFREGEYRYAAGDLLADRFRIVAPLGKGGMGEVYRADDLSLGVSVALKILPERIATNAIWLSRFRKEVASARQVSHPHVCRVFDITESNGQSFLSMEFIAGDDLAAVLQKVGRLSSELAIDLTRQIAQGLHAVHDEGLIHRDLKPANIMIDGRGRAKLSDFGLATAASSVTGNDIYAGTPVYQAPEQLAGETLTERTDLYALGVLSYELLSGRRPFLTTDRDTLIRAQREPIPPPSSFDASITPEVDRIILKCLSYDPLKRPVSAHEVYRALPGDAALNAALAAGVTPSAEAVADAGGEGRLSRRTAFLLAGIIVILSLLGGWLQYRWERGVELVWEPERLEERCRTLLAQAGHPANVRYSAQSFEPSSPQNHWRNKHDRDLDRASPVAMNQLPVHAFSFRVSPVPLIPRIPPREQPIITSLDPPFDGSPSNALVIVDAIGRLIHLRRAPPVPRPTTPILKPDWVLWFREAGFELDRFRAMPPEREWPIPYDERYAWTGAFPDRPSIPVTIEVALDRGELVGFTRVSPWTVPDVEQSQANETQSNYQIWWLAMPTLMTVVGGWLAWRNLRDGTADVRGAWRFATAFSVFHLLLYVIFAGPLIFGDYALSEWYALVARVLMNSLRLGLGYLALEPFVRRRWPWRLIGWRRLLAGRWTDPWVGRDMLIGLMAATVATVIVSGLHALPGLIGLPPELPIRHLMIASSPLGFLISCTLTGFDAAVMVLFIVFFLHRFLRSIILWLPLTIAILILGPLGFPIGTNPAILGWIAPLLCIVVLIILLRYGLLALAVAWVASLTLGLFPIFCGWETWYWTSPALGSIFLIVTLIYGFVTSVGGWTRLWQPDSQV